jgi:putative transposase
MEWRGKPLAIRVVNGPEYVRSTLMTWAEKQGIALTYLPPGKPQQNADVERDNGTVRHEWLDLSIFATIEDGAADRHRMAMDLQQRPPNKGIGGLTPAMTLKRTV